MDEDGFAVANLIERIGQLVRSNEQFGDLNPAQWAALRYLARANRFSRNPIALARYLGTTRGTTSQTLIALERKGYISRNPSERDKRAIDLALTKEGQSKLTEDPVAQVAEIADDVLAGQCAQTRDQLTRILKRLIALNEGRMFDQCRTCRHFQRDASSSKSAPHRCALLEVALSERESEYICVEQEP